MVSCASPRDVVYFQNAQDFETLVNKNTFSAKFKVDDLVGIYVSTLDNEASIPFNLYRGASEGGIRAEQVDYLVDQNGEIDFPVIGKIKISGLSPDEVRAMLTERLSEYLKNPIINIRLRNFTVTVIGEVQRPGTFPVNGERITVLEALGYAGDLTIKGKRENVMVIRDFDGAKVYSRIDLTKKEALESPVFYLTQNDVVYVEPNRSAVTSSSLDNRATIAVSIASVLITSTVLLLTRSNLIKKTATYIMNSSEDNTKIDAVDLKDIVSRYTKHWKWFILSLIAVLGAAFVYIRYTTPEYLAQAKIQIIDDESAGPGLDLFKEIDFFSGSGNEVQDEIEIIKSRSNLIDVVKKLKLNTKIIAVGNIVDSELYTNSPIKINFIAPDSVLNNTKHEFYLTLSSPNTYRYSVAENELEKVYPFGKNVSTPIGDIVITPDPEHFSKFLNKRVKVEVTPVAIVAQEYMKKINVFNADDFSNILSITLEDPIKKKSRDIINSLILIYNENAINDKKVIADRTSNFIDDRIADISSNLSSVDQDAQDLKTEEGITDAQSEASINLNVSAATRQELANFRTQLSIASSMKDLVDSSDGYEVMPSNVGLSDPTIASTTQRYNQLVAERNRLLKSSTEKSPIIVNLDQQLDNLKQSMQSSLNGTVNNLGLQVNTLSGQQAILNSKIYSAPGKERALRDITRKQQTTESLFLYLLEKREEAQIAAASTSPKSKIIDFAFNASELPVSPKKNVIFLAAFLIGLLVPFSIIYAQELLDNKIHNMHTLGKLTNGVPVLGEIPRLSKRDFKLVNKEDRTVLGESLRIIRTNLDYLLKTNVGDVKNNLIYVTSSVPGEGKTFLASNLSMILASTDKKVLLLGADIRNPKLYLAFEQGQGEKGKGRSREAGLTEYLYDSAVEATDIINKLDSGGNSIDVIYSGRIPPNPSELLMSNRLPQLLDHLSKIYDYVVIDTAPLMVVTDTLSVTEYADHVIYVTRADITEKKAVDFPIKLKEEGKIKSLSFVVNDVKASNLGYGGKYGYGYGQTQKKWWKF